MAIELAAAYVTIMPSLKGAQSSIEKQLSGIDATEQGKRLGSSLSGGVSKSLEGVSDAFESVGSKLVGSFSAVAKPIIGAAGAGLGAVFGKAMTGGWQRALNIEHANSLFRGLQMSAEEIESAMTSANAAVKGTAYGLDEAAQAAAMLTASGVQLGDDLDHALRAITGVSTMTGAAMGDITDVFQVVASQGYISGHELTRLAQRGLPGRQKLAEYLDVTMDELNDMIKDKAVSAQDFFNAMFESFGEAAYGANETFSGALANVGAALSRFGAKYAGPLQEALRKTFVAAIPAVDAVNAALDPMVEKFSGFAEGLSGKVVKGIEAFTETVKATSEATVDTPFGEVVEKCPPDFFLALSNGIDAAFGEGSVEKVKQFAVALGSVGAAGVALQLASKGMKAISPAMRVFDGASAALTRMAGGIGKVAPTFKKAGAAAANALKTGLILGVPEAVQAPIRAIGKMAPNLQRNMKVALSRGKSMLSDFSYYAQRTAGGRLLRSLTTPFTIFGDTVAAFGRKAMPALGSAFTGFGNVAKRGLSSAGAGALAMGSMIGKGAILAMGALGGIAVGMLALGTAAMKGGLDIKGATANVLTTMQTLTANVPAMAQQIASELPEAFSAVAEAAPDLAAAFATGLEAIVEILPEMLPKLVDGISNVVDAIGPTLISMGPTVLDAGMKMFAGILEALAKSAPGVVGQIPSLVDKICAVVGQNGPRILTAAGTLFMGFAQAAIQAIPQVVATLVSKIPELAQAVSDGFPDMLAAAQELFGQLGIALGQVAGSLGEAIFYIVTHIPDIIAGAAYLMLEAGKNFVGGFVKGLTGIDVTAPASGIGSEAGTAMINGMDVNAMQAAAAEMASSTVQSMADSADASAVGESIASTAAGAIDPSAFAQATEGMVNSAIAEGSGIDTSGIGSAFSQGAALGIDTYAMTENARAMVRNAIEAANDEAKTGSPSRVMRRFGAYFAEGAGIGIADRARFVSDQSRRMVVDAISAADRSMRMLQWDVLGYSSQPGLFGGQQAGTTNIYIEGVQALPDSRIYDVSYELATTILDQRRA